jgi:serine/threonine protein kinase
MIRIACPECGQRLNARDDMAGKSVRCPQCKNQLKIPHPRVSVATEAATNPPNAPRDISEDSTVPPIRSPAVAATDHTITHFHAPEKELGPDDSAASETDDRSEELKAGIHYQVQNEIARGGMGAIMRAVDQDIRREVAVKFLLNAADDHLKARFVEEAQITGQLEHPNIVPIHQLGVHEDGRCFFSMKMVKGRNLAETLRDRENGYKLSRLLNIFVSVCNAVSYAHARNVIHRDLKPANIMIGDFGEVYVMDWGLAKVLDDPTPTIEMTPASVPRENGDPTLADSKTEPDSKVRTNRSNNDGDKTQAGAVMGTLLYMPPEQAEGQPLDARADIYSLGAILYEIMTLTPPVLRKGDMMAVVMRVIEGKIDAPAERAPERVVGGWVSPELSAIAMKALAKDREARYPSVEALKHDIELFLEGRSVSAKHDTAWEMFKKLVNRNKGVSIATATALVVLTVVAAYFLKINYDERVRAETNYAKYKQEQEEKRAQAKGSVPALVRAARLSANEGHLDDALSQVNLAIGIDDTNADARLLRGQLLIGEQNHAAAQSDLNACLRERPDDAAAKNLLKLCESLHTDNSGELLALADELSRQKAFTIAKRVTDQAEAKILGPRRAIFASYCKRLDEAWPKGGSHLRFDAEGRFSLDFTNRVDVKDLSPLQGMKLVRLALSYCREIRHLDPLVGMPLADLNLTHCKEVRELGPLRDMPLTVLNLSGSSVSDLDPIKTRKLVTLKLSLCTQIRSLDALKNMPLTTLYLDSCTIDNLEPIRNLELVELNLSTCRFLKNLEPLSSMPLKKLLLSGCSLLKERDLLPLKKLRLSTLNLGGCSALQDLSVLEGMKLDSLSIFNCILIKSIEPLRKMPLTTLHMSSTGVSDLSSLQGMRLTTLNLSLCKGVDDLAPLKGAPLRTLYIDGTAVTDLTPLEGMDLDYLRLSPKNITKGIDVLRKMESLTNIVTDDNVSWLRGEFLRKFDAGEFE